MPCCPAGVRRDGSDEHCERELLARWKLGDRSAGDALLQRHVRELRRYFAIRAFAHADDLVQLTLLACTQQRFAFRGASSFRAFLLGLARVQLLRHSRRNSRREPIGTCVDGLAPGPEQLAVEREDQRLLADALQDLPMQQRTVLELSYWHGLGTAEAARVLGVPENTMYSRLHRAKERLRSALVAG